MVIPLDSRSWAGLKFERTNEKEGVNLVSHNEETTSVSFGGGLDIQGTSPSRGAQLK